MGRNSYQEALVAPDKKPHISRTFGIVIDVKLRRPACVLLQAVYGGDPEAFRRYFGGADNWLIDPTPDMRMIEGTDEQWTRFVGGTVLP